jgi:hypothetical protein
MRKREGAGLGAHIDTQHGYNVGNLYKNAAIVAAVR